MPRPRRNATRRRFADLRRSSLTTLPTTSPDVDRPTTPIGELAEYDLHSQLKRLIAGETGRTEVKVGRYWIDVHLGDELVEIQTAGFGKLRIKLANLLPEYRLRLVHPIAATKTLATFDRNGRLLRERRSPKRGRWEHVFNELMSIAHLARHPNFSLEVFLIDEEEWRTDRDQRRRWGKSWTSVNRRLSRVVERLLFRSPSDLLRRLPIADGAPFTNKSLARRGEFDVDLASRITYCLRRLNLIELVSTRPAGEDRKAAARRIARLKALYPEFSAREHVFLVGDGGSADAKRRSGDAA